jgi:hypothetical protein
MCIVGQMGSEHTAPCRPETLSRLASRDCGVAVTGDASILDTLREWFTKERAGLLTRGLTVQLGDPSDSRGNNPSICLDIDSASRLGQLILWSSGDAELQLADVSQETSWLDIVGSKRGTVHGPAVPHPAAGMTGETVSPCVSRMIQRLWTLSLAWLKPM